MHRETYLFSLLDPILLLHQMVGMVVTQHSLPIAGSMRNGFFYPDINPYPFMNAMVEAFLEKRSSALGEITENPYPHHCYVSLQGWNVPETYWNSVCREVFNSLAHALHNVIPDYRQDDSTRIDFGITENDDLMFFITRYA